MNRAQFRDWALAQGSVAKYDDGLYRGQCVSLINQYCWRVLGVPAGAWGDAKDWASGTALQYFDRVGDLQDGDILVYPGNASNQYGHIEIYLGGNMSLQQNRFFDGKVGVNPTIAGYTAIRKKSVKQGDTGMKIGSGANWKWRFNRLHHQLVRNGDMSDAVFKAIQGADAWHTVEGWSDHAEANRLLEYQVIGEMAYKDQWQKQIYDLQKTVADLKTRPTQAQLNELKAQIAKLSGDTKNAQAEATEARRQAAEDKAKYNELKTETDKAEKEASNFLTALINAVRGMFGGK